MKLILIIVVNIFSVLYVFAQEGFVIDHNHTDISMIPDQWIDSAKQKLKIRYFRRSHGSQLDTGGMNALHSFSPEYALKYNYSKTGGNGKLFLSVPEPWVSLDSYIPGTSTPVNWVQITRDYLDDPENAEINVVMWAWSSDFYLFDPNEYITRMETLISEYGPGGSKIQSGVRSVPVTFVYQTACSHFGLETNQIIYEGNMIIRNHCIENNRILYDFNDLESWDPDGNYYGDGNPDGTYTNIRKLNDDAAYISDSTHVSVHEYNGELRGNWGIEWRARNPGSELTMLSADNNCINCYHSMGVYAGETKDNSRLHCVLKGRAAWWLWARLAGWGTTSKSLTASPDQALTEANLNNAAINLILNGETFQDNVLSLSNFTLSGAPSGLGIGSVSFTDNSHATVVLSFNGTDFDSNLHNFRINISGSELTGGTGLNSNNLTITALIESAIIATNPGMNETNLNNKQITLTLQNERFIDNSILLSNIHLNNHPQGLTISGITYIDNTNANLLLTYNGSDFDVNISNFNITISEVELVGTSNLTSNNLPILANNEGLLISANPELLESELNDKQILLSLTGESFIDESISLSNVTLNNGPQGLSVISIILTDNTHAIITLTFNGNDFDENISNFNITISEVELIGTSNLTSNNLPILANNEGLLISASPELLESELNDKQISLSLTGESFIDESISLLNVTLNNEPQGLSIKSIVYTDNTHATITLAFDSTDFDENISNFDITISEAELVGTSNLTSNNLPILANNETLVISTNPEMIESNLNDKQISLSLTDDSFIDESVSLSNVSLNNEPQGLSVKSIIVTDNTHGTITLTFDGTDFDENITDFSVTILENELTGLHNLVSNVLNISAINETSAIKIFDESLLKIYPNPGNGKFTVKLQNAEFKFFILKIFDYKGSLLDEKRGKYEDSGIDFDYSNLEKGVYFIHLSIAGKNYYSKLIFN